MKICSTRAFHEGFLLHYHDVGKDRSLVKYSECTLHVCIVMFFSCPLIALIYMYMYSLDTKCKGQADLTTLFRCKDPEFWGDIIIRY
jgi:hypothetical protein